MDKCTYHGVLLYVKMITKAIGEGNMILGMDSDQLIAITSICAVIISMFSLVLTIITSFLQMKHNKNSIKPIADIRVQDYEDMIAVRIENVGTGPLVVKKLIFTRDNDNREYSSLIEMMPYIKEPWATFFEKADGWKISVDGKIDLLELSPSLEESKESVREALSTITVSLTYTDVYGTVFKESRKLDFFGRHFCNQ